MFAADTKRFSNAQRSTLIEVLTQIRSRNILLGDIANVTVHRCAAVARTGGCTGGAAIGALTTTRLTRSRSSVQLTACKLPVGDVVDLHDILDEPTKRLPAPLA